MQSPADGVPLQLINHVHLRSFIQFPFAPQPLPLENILDQLLKAPQVVRDGPVAWTYLQAPTDGTLMLTWRPSIPVARPFGSDGIVWVGSEAAFKQTIGDYTIEGAMYTSGFIPGQDQVISHRRMRYRITSAANNAPFDPNLEIVHWLAASPEHRMPARMAQAQIGQPQTIQMRERRILEMQGPLPRKEFMLNDRASWPSISLPGNPLPQIPQNPYQNPMQNRTGMPAYNRTPSGNRPLATGLPNMPGAMVKPGMMAGPIPTPFSNLAEDILENERNTEFGDFLDFLSPREISIARYKQHHEWMEELLASPYAMKDILPVDLGLRLAGSLKGLTDDLWGDAATLGAEGAAKEVDPERLKAFEAKVATHVSTGEQELAEMRRDHAQKMAQIQQQDIFKNLELKLATSNNTHVSIVELEREAEQALGGRLVGRPEIAIISRGGLLNKGEENLATQHQPDEFHPDFGNLDSAGEALDFYNQEIEFPA